jgi:hypothetical protein
MENLPVHKIADVRQAIEALGAQLLYLLFARLESDRNGLLRTESAFAEGSRAHNSRLVAQDRAHR